MSHLWARMWTASCNRLWQLGRAYTVPSVSKNVNSFVESHVTVNSGPQCHLWASMWTTSWNRLLQLVQIHSAICEQECEQLVQIHSASCEQECELPPHSSICEQECELLSTAPTVSNNVNYLVESPATVGAGPQRHQWAGMWTTASSAICEQECELPRGIACYSWCRPRAVRPRPSLVGVPPPGATAPWTTSLQRTWSMSMSKCACVESKIVKTTCIAKYFRERHILSS